MKVMVLIKGTAEDEPKIAPTAEMMAAMGEYNQKLMKAGILLEGGGLRPSADGRQVILETDGTTSVVDGPFTESKEIIAGYWVWQVSSIEEAVEWARQCPTDPKLPLREVLEIRPYYEEADFEHLV